MQDSGNEDFGVLQDIAFDAAPLWPPDVFPASFPQTVGSFTCQKSDQNNGVITSSTLCFHFNSVVRIARFGSVTREGTALSSSFAAQVSELADSPSFIPVDLSTLYPCIIRCNVLELPKSMGLQLAEHIREICPLH